jgi:tRNA(Ile)-lysidine synthase
MRLARGAGPDGLTGIAASRPLGEGVTLVRPLRSIARDDVLAYCARREIPYRSDATNADRRLARVRARLDLVPRLERLSPGAAANLARAAELAAADRAYFAARVAELFDAWGVASGPPVVLPATSVAELAPALRGRVLREAVRRARGDLRRLSNEHVAALELLLEPGRGGRETVLPFGLRARREGRALVVGAAVEICPPSSVQSGTAE